MNESLKYQRVLTVVILLLGVVGFGLLFILVPDDHSIANGWGVGVLLGLGLFRYRAATVLSLFERPQEEWTSVSIKSSLISYALIIGAAGGALALKRLTDFDLFHPFAVLGGVILERVVLWADGFLRPSILQPNSEKEQA
jgi:hypothetical protein